MQYTLPQDTLSIRGDNFVKLEKRLSSTNDYWGT